MALLLYESTEFFMPGPGRRPVSWIWKAPLTMKGRISSLQKTEIWSCNFLGTLLPLAWVLYSSFLLTIRCYCCSKIVNVTIKFCSCLSWYILSEVVFNTSYCSVCVCPEKSESLVWEDLAVEPGQRSESMKPWWQTGLWKRRELWPQHP